MPLAFRNLMELFISTASNKSLIVRKEFGILLEVFVKTLTDILKNKLLKCACKLQNILKVRRLLNYQVTVNLIMSVLKVLIKKSIMLF